MKLFKNIIKFAPKKNSFHTFEHLTIHKQSKKRSVKHSFGALYILSSKLYQLNDLNFHGLNVKIKRKQNWKTN